jgi:hypothetical protein
VTVKILKRKVNAMCRPVDSDDMRIRAGDKFAELGDAARCDSEYRCQTGFARDIEVVIRIVISEDVRAGADTKRGGHPLRPHVENEERVVALASNERETIF